MYAQNYIEYLLDDLEHNQTIIYCPGEDSIKLYSPTGATEPSWLINNYEDTIYYETLTLENGYQGLVSFQNFPDIVFNLHLYPLTINFQKEHTIVCGETLSLDAVTSNYNGTDPLSYQWSPATGLNDPAVPDPNISSTNNDIIGTIGILNIGGQLLKEFNTPGNETTINLENLAPGIYFIRISNNNEVYTQKFTKQ